MEITISFFEEWMKPQVIQLICQQYNYNPIQYEKFFNSFYSCNYQQKAIKIVALDGNKVIGFQSFFYWPYVQNEKKLNTYQSGNSIVNNEYRGKGIFQKMLTFIYENPTNIAIDFFVGFPVEASYKSFIKCNWQNPFNLIWHIKINNPFSVFFKINEKVLEENFETKQSPNLLTLNNSLKLSDEEEFIYWRTSYYKSNHYYFSFKQNNKICQIGFKINTRKKYIKELIIGQINGNDYNEAFLNLAMKEFIKQVKKIKFITIISIACNPYDKEINLLMQKLNFKPTKKRIYFIYKNFSCNSSIIDNSNWSLFRGDIDTW